MGSRGEEAEAVLAVLNIKEKFYTGKPYIGTTRSIWKILERCFVLGSSIELVSDLMSVS
jgi:hypothetical protein